ncbi:Proton-dependent oligopeptide transporter family, partial [Dillenia turbinata]
GMCALTLAVSVSALKPPPCSHTNGADCEKASTLQLAVFFGALYMLTIGTGGTRPNISTIGADQFDEFYPKEKAQKLSFFNRWMFCTFFGTLFANTLLVYIQDNVGWTLGYGLPTVGLAISIIIFLSGTPFYRHKVPSGSPFTRMASVIVASFRKWNVPVPSDPEELYEVDLEVYTKAGKYRIDSTPTLRFLNKACVKTGSTSPWMLCSVTQVEETKQMLRMIPILVATFVPSMVVAQTNTLFVKRVTTLDRQIGSFKIPPASVQGFVTISTLICVVLYDRFFVTIMRKWTKNPRGISLLQRMGIGMAIHFIIMLISSFTERYRLSVAKDHELVQSGGQVPLTIFILLPQFVLMGMADAFLEVAKIEFFYDQAPENMKSLGTSYSMTSLGIGNILSSFLLSSISHITKNQGDDWIKSNLNASHLDYYYAFFAILNFLNFIFFLAMTKFYVYKAEVTDSMEVLAQELRDSSVRDLAQIEPTANSNGMFVLTLAVSVSALKPPPCSHTNGADCEKASTLQLAVFFGALYTLPIGTGGTRPNISTIGADQFDEFDPKEKAHKLSFFNWWMFCTFFGTLFANTLLVYIQDNMGWTLGYGLPTVGLAISITIFLSGTSFYRHKVPSGSPFTRMARVIVASFGKWNVPVPSDPKELYELDLEVYTKAGKYRIHSTPTLRLLNKACVKTGSTSPWMLCSVTQVEETKQMLRMIPILVATFIPSTIAAQINTFFVKRVTTLGRQIGSFKIPPASVQGFTTISMLIYLVLYDRFFVTIMRKWTKNPRGISLLQRMGIGMAIHIIIMLISSFTERHRLSVARDHGLVQNEGQVPLTIFILLPQFMLIGTADAFFEVAKTEFFYDQEPENMKSLGASYSMTSLGIGNFLSSFLLSTVSHITRNRGDDWIKNNLNASHLDYYYAFFAILSFLNFMFFLVMTRFYVYKAEVTDSMEVLAQELRGSSVRDLPQIEPTANLNVAD